MSILQEYENIRKDMGSTRFDAIGDYLEEVNNNRDNELFLSDVLYKEKEYIKFEEWFYKQIKPFTLFKNENNISMLLNVENFKSEMFKSRNGDGIYGNGYDWDSLVRTYVECKLPHLSNKLTYDSENGMLCVDMQNQKQFDELAYNIAKDYKKENGLQEYIEKMQNFDIYL